MDSDLNPAGTSLIFTWLIGATLAGCGGAPVAADPPAPAKVEPTTLAVPTPVSTAPAKTGAAVSTTPAAPTPVITAPVTVDPVPVITAPVIPKPGEVASPSADTCAPTVPKDISMADTMDLYRAACGVLLVTRDDGLTAMTPGLTTIARILSKQARRVHVQREGDVRELYYFAADAPELVRLNLHSVHEQVLVTLPGLTHPCFTGAEPGEKVPPADPVAYIQSAHNLDLDLAAGVLCLEVGDRNDNMVSLQLNFRADLRTGKVVQRTTFVGDDCKQGAGREQKAACELSRKDVPVDRELPEIGHYGQVSPSGQWAFYTDENFEQSADYIYSAAFVRDLRSRTSYALTPAGRVKFAPAGKALEALPEGTCMLPGEASPRWLPERDILLVDGCGRAPWLVVEPPGRVQAVVAHEVAIY